MEIDGKNIWLVPKHGVVEMNFITGTGRDFHEGSRSMFNFVMLFKTRAEGNNKIIDVASIFRLSDEEINV